MAEQQPQDTVTTDVQVNDAFTTKVQVDGRPLSATELKDANDRGLPPAVYATAYNMKGMG